MEKEKKFVYLVDSYAGYYETGWRKTIGVTDSIEKAKKLAEDFNNECVEECMELPMSYDFFMSNIEQASEEQDDYSIVYSDYIGYTAQQWQEMQIKAQIIDEKFSLAFIREFELL